jgi:hypothetical protein
VVERDEPPRFPQEIAGEVPPSLPQGGRVSIRDRERSPLQILRNIQIRALNLNREMEMLEAARLIQIQIRYLIFFISL